MECLILPNKSKYLYEKNSSAFSTLCENIKKLRLHNFPFGDGDWRDESLDG